MPPDPSNNKRVRMVDVAARVRCSQAAVSHALSGTGVGQIRLSPERIAEIRRVAAEMGYQPNYAARQLTGKRSHVIGVVVDVLLTATHARILAWIQHLAYQLGLHVLVMQTANETSRVQQAVDQYTRRGLEGLIYVAYLNDAHWSAAAEVLAACPNLVSVLGRPTIEGSPYIDVDVADGAGQSVMHLVDSGRQNIVLLLDDLESSWNRSRRDGFLEAHRHLGRDVNEDHVCVADDRIDWSQPDPDARVDRMIATLIDGRGADAIVTDDTMAGLLSQGLARRGIRVPQDVALVGHGNEVLVHFTYPRLTTIDIRIHEVMERAVNTLAASIEDCPPPQVNSEVIQPKLLVREST